jgi:hypothetical protein
MWVILAAIGLVSTILMLVHDRLAHRIRTSA